MTLIQTVVTEDLVIQVADRRLTWPSGRVEDDEFTKLVFWRGCFSVGFTGFARFDATATKSTSEWIAEVLADCHYFEEGVLALEREATKRIKTIIGWSDYRLEIVIAGFDFRRDAQVGRIRNFEPGGPTPTNQTEFTHECMSKYPSHPATFVASGTPLARRWQRNALVRYIPRILKQPNGIERAVTLMVALQRNIADREARVGRDAMCVVIPRERRVLGMIANLGAPKLDGEGVKFGYFADKGFNYEQFGPHVANDGAAFGNWTGSMDPVTGNQRVGIKVIKLPKQPTQGPEVAG